MNVGIIGFGLMGQERARAVDRLKEHRLVAVSDVDTERAKTLQAKMRYEIAPSWELVASRPDIEAVIVSVPHNLAPDMVVAALQAGKHVLCEKPLGRTTAESRRMVRAAGAAGRYLEPGFNYRFYPGVRKMKELLDSGGIGDVGHARCVIGHGGRPGYDKEWKLSKEHCGGGALFDPGIHAVDLFRFLFGEIVEAKVFLWNAFWDIDVEDNAFAHFRTAGDVMVSLHASITEWKNRFSLEVFGTEGYLSLEGRSKNYGPQRLRMGKRWFWLDDPPIEEQDWAFSADEDSFYEETKAFLETIQRRPDPSLATANDGLRAVETVDILYNRQGSELTRLALDEAR